ncbi:MAG: STAS domain-containing protein, partial [Myxococcales bacterium]|nr:STAS domain-containing protein [Myxococcales bacterium]
LISALGGSHVQIGGPTGAFVVIVYAIVQKHGYDGLALATLMAGAILILLGVLKLGVVIKYIPYPVVTGFTSGIAVLIFSSQVRDFVGLSMDTVPADFLDKWSAYADRIATWSPHALGIALGSMAIILFFRRHYPRIPGPPIAIVVAAAAVALFHLPVETIGSRFGGIPQTLPLPSLPAWSVDKIRLLIPEAFTIAMLGAIESLLSAVVADGMTGHRHRSNDELIGQGIANIAAILFGGIPATGAIARTATNIRSGAKTPVAGMIHAITLLLVMLIFAPLAKEIPLASLAAVLVIVAWNMAEVDHFRSLLRAPRSDVAVLLITFALTVLVDLTVAVEVGIGMAAVLFMKRMSDVTDIGTIVGANNGDADAQGADPESIERRAVPDGVEVYEIDGPFFFGVADKFKDTIGLLETPPRIFILRMRRVPAMDATGLHALEEFHAKCRREGTHVILSGVQPQPLRTMKGTGFEGAIGEANIVANIDEALARARGILATEGAAD